MNLKTAINTLELKEFRGIEDLKAQFYKLAHLYHPDKNPDEDSQVFRDMLGAYEYALSHISELCTHFDVPEQPDDEVTAKSTIENLDDIFEDIFGFSKSGRVLGFQEPQVVYLKLEELVLGAKKRQKMIAYAKCPTCQGIGAREGASARVCTYCFGHGVIKGHRFQKIRRRICPKCKGRGREIARACERCNGFGRLRRFHNQEFTLPLGLQPHEFYTITGYDRDTKGATEIFIEPRLLRHPIFQIDNYDLLCEYHVDFTDLNQALNLKLTTPFGSVPMMVPTDAQRGDAIRIKGAGLYKDALKKKRGDLVVTLVSKKKSILTRLFGGLFGK